VSEVPFILWLDESSAAGNPLLGGKFANLGEMTAAGFAVPPGFGITTTAYRYFLRSAGLEDEARRVRAAAPGLQLSEIRRETAVLLAGIANAPFPPDLEALVRENYARLESRLGVADVPVAVRSSGESEDLAGASFAGQYDSFLWICGADALLVHVRACWAGMFGEAVLSYRQNGDTVISQGDFAMCVGVQHMVQARAAGVLFTLDPITGDRSKMVLEACWGLGEGVVKGDVTPSRFTVDKVTMELIKRDVTPQTEEYRFEPGAAAVRLAPIEAQRQGSPCVSDDEVRTLATLAKRIETTRGAPQDIEWAVSHRGDVWVLQVRPETVWSRRERTPLVTASRSPVAHVLSRLSGVKVTRSTGSPSKP
jgi:pyruvate,water dikinase